ncbi:ArsR/SmtB family transcription factor [Promineifilum sp.]|uniref:ArsR/SmtB family transcription factor n=1 Tax=Promineifilum sp. TaxID=2664178 RepID=UPI0035B192CF
MTSHAPIEWDIGTAYDFFVSLSVLHEPDKFGLRGSWAAGVRSRLPVAERELLQRASDVIWPLPWVYSLPKPKDGATVLAALREMPAAGRLEALLSRQPEPVNALLHDVSARRNWQEADQDELVRLMMADDWKKHPAGVVRKVATSALDLWRDPTETGDGLLAALGCYYAEFFAEEEIRIRPMLEAALERAQTLARRLLRPKLLEELSQGVRMSPEWERKSLILAPSFWGTPLALMAKMELERGIILFGARPADASLIPGELVPDALYQALKALADPTRLRILRYLTEEPLTPAELARRLRLRAPTVIHHLDALRLARVVIVTLEAEGKRYAIRPEAIDAVCGMLHEFLAATRD